MDAEREIPVLGMNAQEVADAIGVARSFLYEMDKVGQLGPQAVKLGSRRIWSAVELHHWTLYGMPSRSRWLEMWPSIRSVAQEPAKIGQGGPKNGHYKGSSVSCRGAS